MKEIKLKMMTADICGNKTAFVVFPVDPRVRAPYAEHIMREIDPTIEQVGFIAPSYEDKPLRMDMAGGEFCANATRAYGLYDAICNDVQGMDSVFVYVSGADEPVEVRVNTDINYAMVDMPFVEKMEEVEIGGKKYPVVTFPGISHMIVEEEPSEEKAREYVIELREKVDNLAYGILFLDREKTFVTPYVHVLETKTFIKESSCGSGAAAVGYYLADGKDREIEIAFEGGILDVECQNLEGHYYVSVGSEISFTPIEIISIHAENDSYYIKKYYEKHPEEKREYREGI